MRKLDSGPVDKPGQCSEALTSLYEQYSERIFLYLQYRCDDPATAHDLAGQVFEQLIRSYSDYTPERAPLSAWVFSIARHVVIDWQRRQYRRKFFPWEDFFRHPSSNPGPEQMIVESEERRQLRVALRELSSRERDLVALRFSSGLTNRRIAEITGLTESNVAVILYRALRKLRERLTLPEEVLCSNPACLMEVDHE
jgi:RNA polymerase sigma-70 factor (ECF subfamily)